MLTYFWGMGTYFHWGDGSISLFILGGWVEIFGEMNTPIPPRFAPLVAKLSESKFHGEHDVMECRGYDGIAN